MTTEVKEVQDAANEAAHLLTIIEATAGLISDLSLNDGDDAILKGFERADAISTAARIAGERLEVTRDWLCNAALAEMAKAEAA